MVGRANQSRVTSKVASFKRAKGVKSLLAQRRRKAGEDIDYGTIILVH